MAEHKGVKLTVRLEEETVVFPEFDLKDKDYFFLPFHMKIKNAVLKTAMVTPLCILNGSAYIFYGDRAPEFDIQGDLGDTVLICLSRKDALNAWKISLNKEHLIISDAAVLQTERGIELIGRGQLRLKVYPDFDTIPEGFTKSGRDGEFTLYDYNMTEQTVQTVFHLAAEETKVKAYDQAAEETEAKTYDQAAEETQMKTYDLKLELPKEKPEDCFLRISYQGDRAGLYLNQELIADHYYTGRDWEVGLKQFDFPDSLVLKVYPLQGKAEVYLEQWPVMKDKAACELSRVSAEIEYKVIISKE
jgi:hypothetical protein